MEKKTITPPEITKRILTFCNKINSTVEPHYVNVTPISEAIIYECFNNVINHIEKNGGMICNGWMIWLWHNVMIEAEAHAIWISPTGEEYDITPKEENKILFLPDTNVEYIGKRIPNKRVALTDSKLVEKLILLSNEKDRLLSESSTGEIDLSEFGSLMLQLDEIIRTIKQKAGRNDLCPCQSGLKHKKCCGS